MERLTERFKNGQAAVYGCGNNCKYDFKYCNNYLNDCPTINEMYDKLVEYEDLEEQGKLLKLPCAAGDTVYHLCIFENGESEIVKMKVGCVEPYGAIMQHKGIYKIWNVYAEADHTKAYFKFFDFEKTVFLTKEKAEAALKELERGKGE